MEIYIDKTFGNAATPVPIKINIAMDGLGMTANDVFDIIEYSTSRFLAIHQAMIKYHDGDEAIFNEGDEDVAVTYRDEFASPVAIGLTWGVRNFISPLVQILNSIFVVPPLTTYLTQILQLDCRSQWEDYTASMMVEGFMKLHPDNYGPPSRNAMRAALNYSFDWWNDACMLTPLRYSDVNKLVDEYRKQLKEPIIDETPKFYYQGHSYDHTMDLRAMKYECGRLQREHLQRLEEEMVHMREVADVYMDLVGISPIITDALDAAAVAIEHQYD